MAEPVLTATYKYLDTGGDAVAQAEGETFYTGIRSRVVEADPEADSVIVAAFATDDADSGRAALHRPAVLAALGIDDAERVDRG